MRSDTGCENLRSRLFGLAERSEDLAPFAARGGAFLTGAEAAISIPASAIAEAEAATIPVGTLPRWGAKRLRSARQPVAAPRHPVKKERSSRRRTLLFSSSPGFT